MFIITFNKFKISASLIIVIIILALNTLDNFTDFETINITYYSEHFLSILVSF